LQHNGLRAIIRFMKFSLRTLMIAVTLGPALLAGVFFLLREVSLAAATLGIGFALLALIAVYDFVRGV
jgi:hypothetical protein